MASPRSTTTVRTPTAPVTAHPALRFGVLLSAYVGTLLLVGAASVVTVIYTTTALAVPVAVELAVWVAGIGGVAAAPTAAGRVVAVLDEALASSATAPDETALDGTGEAVSRPTASSTPNGGTGDAPRLTDPDESRVPVERVIGDGTEPAAAPVEPIAE